MNAGTRDEIGLLRIAKECATGIGRGTLPFHHLLFSLLLVISVIFPDDLNFTEWKGKVAKCAAGQEGINLLKDSLTLAQELNITKSCTMIINGKQVSFLFPLPLFLQLFLNLSSERGK